MNELVMELINLSPKAAAAAEIAVGVMIALTAVVAVVSKFTDTKKDDKFSKALNKLLPILKRFTFNKR